MVKKGSIGRYVRCSEQRTYPLVYCLFFTTTNVPRTYHERTTNVGHGDGEMTNKQKKHDLHLMINTTVIKEAKKTIPNLSAFVQDILERELAGEFKQLKIDKLEQELASAKAENSHIQTQQQKQQERAKKTYEDAEAEMLERRRQNMLRRKEGI